MLPSVVPAILTAWKVNLGNAARVVVVAELVGATGGVGYELIQQQQLFDMAGAIAWTLQLVIFVLLVQGAVTAIEAYALRYRGMSERGVVTGGPEILFTGRVQALTNCRSGSRSSSPSSESTCRSGGASCWRCWARRDAASRRCSA